MTRLINNLNSNEHMSLTFVAVPVSLHIKMVMNMIMVMLPDAAFGLAE